MSLAAGEVFAGYTVVRLLTSDGMGEVYLAKHPGSARQDVLRVLPASVSDDAEFRARFDREAAAAGTLWHPHLVGVQGHGEHLGRLWIATDYVDGTDAAAVIRDQHPIGMPPAEVVDIVTAVADALDYARGRLLLHHDVTPSNILLTPAPTRRILLTDFGIPRLSGALDDRTAVNLAIDGQPIRTVDGREDQYDLAATAYHLLSGTPKFAHLLGHTRPDLAAFDPALARAMAKDPAERFDTCLAFAGALRDGLAGTANTVASPTVRTEDPTAASPVAGFATGPKQPVFTPAWSEEPPPNPYLDPVPDPYPDPAFSPTMTAMPVPRDSPQAPSGPKSRTWAIAGLAAVVVVIVIGVAVLVSRDDGEPSAQPSARPSTSDSELPPAPPTSEPAPEPSPLPDDGAGRRRVEPPPIDGPDGVGESCRDGYQITGQDGWASHGVRGNLAATCVFTGNVLKAYWDAADPADGPRTIVAAGAIPCSAGAECEGDAFVVSCAVEGSDPWVTCRGGRDAVVYLY